MRYYVEYDFITSGIRTLAMSIRFFATEQAARDFAATTPDGIVGYEIPIDC